MCGDLTLIYFRNVATHVLAYDVERVGEVVKIVEVHADVYARNGAVGIAMLHEEPTQRFDAVGLVASSVGKSDMAGAQREDTSLLLKRVGKVSYLVSWLLVLR